MATPNAGIVHSIQVSLGGVPKWSVPSVAIDVNGLDGDRHDDLKHHGGPERAVSLWSLEIIRALQLEGHPIAPGSAGENLTLSGLDWRAIEPGDLLAVGERVRLAVASYASPCRTIQGAFADGRFGRIAHARYPGESRLYARVLCGGLVRVGDAACVTRGARDD